MFTESEKLILAQAKRILESCLNTNPVISNWQVLQDYCVTLFAGAEVEKFFVLYLDNQNRLIDCQQMAQGTVNHVPVYPREVIKAALNNQATALILAHNHPSGNPAPSDADISMTKEIAKGCKFMGITLHDHIIIGGNAAYSMKGAKLF